MEGTINYIPVKQSCCAKHYPRIPYTHCNKTYDVCCLKTINNDKSTFKDGCSTYCTEMALCCCPCALVLDIICCIPMIFGYCKVSYPNTH